MINNFNIVGSGVFGTFIARELCGMGYQQCDKSNHIIMAVPLSAYMDVAKQHHDKHLINVCSVQAPSNEICKKFSAYVTGIHPLFGVNSPITGRNSIVTQSCQYTQDVVEIFSKFGSVHYSNQIEHDDIMRKTHLPVLLFGQMASEVVEKASDVPDYYITPSFRKLRELAYQMRDMSDGTKSSILSNIAPIE